MKLLDLINTYKKSGYEDLDAVSKVCQDIILLKISKSSLNKNVTIKGGVVIHSISNDLRRATRDLDFDFIKYSLANESIEEFINKLNKTNVPIKLEMNGKIEELHHQDYDGKRVYIRLIDETGFSVDTKLDIGVYKDFDIEQDEYCFELNGMKETATLFINSKEQIFVEKLKSLLKFGYTSTRYKDIFDFYYLINSCKLNRETLIDLIDKLIIHDNNIRMNSVEEIVITLKNIFSNRRYLSNLNRAKINWLDLPVNEVVSNVIEFIETIQTISV